jgi:hypothetical protein
MDTNMNDTSNLISPDEKHHACARTTFSLSRFKERHTEIKNNGHDNEDTDFAPISFGIDMTAGIFGGCAGVLAGHPLVINYFNLGYREVNNYITKSTITNTSNWWENGHRKLHHQYCKKRRGTLLLIKFKGFYKGMASPIVGVAAINSLLFAVYGSAIRAVAKDPEAPRLMDIYISGAISGFVNGFFSTPMELGILGIKKLRFDYKVKNYIMDPLIV